MSVDPAGTAPGLSNRVGLDAKTIQLKCRNPKCECIEAQEINIQGATGQRLYRCVKCGHSWGVNTGGSVSL